MKNKSEARFFSSDFVFKQFFGHILEKDDGIDAEELTQLALNSLEKASLYREWPVISNLLNGLAKDLQRKDLK